jgi:NADPH:quinone reductase-like Zn-dependent oxidoreductase
MNMKAALYKTYGSPSVLQIESIPMPSLEGENASRVLVKVHYASINPIDFLFRSGFLPVRPSAGWLKPKSEMQIRGADVAGEVVAIGSKVTRFKVGDVVFGNCRGSHAEFVAVHESLLVSKPSNLSFKEAAAIPLAAQTALQALRDVGGIQKGQRVLINGASGGIGHFAVQLAKYFGCHVTAVCSTSNLEWVKKLGADIIQDYTATDFTKQGKQYDIIYDTVGKRSYLSCKPSLSRTGIYIGENPFKTRFQILQMIVSRLTKDKQLGTHLTNANHKDLEFLSSLVETGQLKPIIEKAYSLEQIAEAHRHGERGHTKGKIVIEVHKS